MVDMGLFEDGGHCPCTACEWPDGVETVIVMCRAVLVCMINWWTGAGRDVTASIPAFECVSCALRVGAGKSWSWFRTSVEDGQFLFSVGIAFVWGGGFSLR